MSNIAIEKSFDAYPLLELENIERGAQRAGYRVGYEQAEKDTIERAVAWLKEHANDYIVDLTPTYPDAPSDIIIGGKCWDDLKEYMENE
jgi:hypothetical protein